jgi:hypothetical protein
MLRSWFSNGYTRIAAGSTGLAVLALLGGNLFYGANVGEGCARCHEIRPMYEAWTNSTHRSVPCSDCHGGTLDPDPSFHAGNLRRLVMHLTGRPPEQIRIRHTDVDRLLSSCERCHRQQFADWKSGPHGATYERIFADSDHNAKRMLMDDCFRCHGMHYAGDIGDLVEPLSLQGPWRLSRGEMGAKPAIPCMACHKVHRLGEPRTGRPKVENPHQQERIRPSLALFDRRTGMHIPAADLPLPVMMDGERRIGLSQDPRQALCYQCHAPLPGAQAGSGDDRTPRGVHEGISCLACHGTHGQNVAASCATCHPRLSNCGLDVEKMDTTFASKTSRHNIHSVTCANCHPKGVPPGRRQLEGPVARTVPSLHSPGGSVRPIQALIAPPTESLAAAQ